jgi:hypothetical protein
LYFKKILKTIKRYTLPDSNFIPDWMPETVFRDTFEWRDYGAKVLLPEFFNQITLHDSWVIHMTETPKGYLSISFAFLNFFNEEFTKNSKDNNGTILTIQIKNILCISRALGKNGGGYIAENTSEVMKENHLVSSFFALPINYLVPDDMKVILPKIKELHKTQILYRSGTTEIIHQPDVRIILQENDGTYVKLNLKCKTLEMKEHKDGFPRREDW